MFYLRAENFLYNILKCVFSVTEPIIIMFTVKLEMENYKYFPLKLGKLSMQKLVSGYLKNSISEILLTQLEKPYLIKLYSSILPITVCFE